MARIRILIAALVACLRDRGDGFVRGGDVAEKLMLHRR